MWAPFDATLQSRYVLVVAKYLNSDLYLILIIIEAEKLNEIIGPAASYCSKDP